MFEITARTNAHNQTISIDGEEFGGGPYQVCVNRAHAPVSVSKIPVWADGWHQVWCVLRALLSAWEFNADDRQPKTPAESIVCARLLWRAAVKLARAGKLVTCWSILAAAYPTPRKPCKPRRLVGRLLSHTTDGRAIVVYGGRGVRGLDGGTIVVVR